MVALGVADYSGSESVWTARVFHYSGGSWQQVGSNIVGPSSEGSTAKVSISSDGKVLAVGTQRCFRPIWRERDAVGPSPNLPMAFKRLGSV